MRVGRRHRNWVVADVADRPGCPEMMPVWASMLRPVGSAAEKVSVSPAAGAAKWLATLSEKLALVGALVCDGRGGGPAVAYRQDGNSR